MHADLIQDDVRANSDRLPGRFGTAQLISNSSHVMPVASLQDKAFNNE